MIAVTIHNDGEEGSLRVQVQRAPSGGLPPGVPLDFAAGAVGPGRTLSVEIPAGARLLITEVG